MLFILSLSSIEIRAEAAEYEISFRQAPDTDGLIMEKQVQSLDLFSNMELIPGYREDARIQLINKSGTDIFYRIQQPLFKAGNDLLFESFEIDIRDEAGTILYSGPLSELDLIAMPVPQRSERILELRLRLPAKVGNEIMGESCAFGFRLWFSDSIAGLSDENLDKDPNEEGKEPDDPGGGASPGGDEGMDPDLDVDEGDGHGQGQHPGSGDDGDTVGDGDEGHSQGDESGQGSGSGAGSGSGGGASGGSGGGHSSGSGGGGSYVVTYGSGSYTGSYGSGPGSSSDSLILCDTPDFSRTSGYNRGSWVLFDKERSLWGYKLPSGDLIRSGFAYLFNPYSGDEGTYDWYYFDKNGYMGIAWIKTEGDRWYFAHDISDGDLGSLKTGWHTDREDKRTYYLSPADGCMHTGWLRLTDSGVDKYYFFARLEETYKQNWFFNLQLGRWIYDMLGDRTYGSMYRDEMTPDGYYVDKDGVRVERA